MYRKGVFMCALYALFIQAISTQSIGATESHGYTASWGPAPSTTATCSWGTSYLGSIEWEYAPASTPEISNGPGLVSSPTIPTGVAVVSNTAHEGLASSAVPSGSVALEGPGTGAIAYGCGNSVGITTEDVSAYGFTGMAGVGYGDGVSVPVVYGSGIGYGPSGYGAMI